MQYRLMLKIYYQQSQNGGQYLAVQYYELNSPTFILQTYIRQNVEAVAFSSVFHSHTKINLFEQPEDL